MQITNPLKEKIHVQIKGISYEIEGGDTLYNIPEDIARDWQEKTHSFIILRKDKLEDKKVAEVVEVPTPKVNEFMLGATPTIESNPSTVVVEETPVEVKEEVVVPAKSKGQPKKIK